MFNLLLRYSTGCLDYPSFINVRSLDHLSREQSWGKNTVGYYIVPCINIKELTQKECEKCRRQGWVHNICASCRRMYPRTQKSREEYHFIPNTYSIINIRTKNTQFVVSLCSDCYYSVIENFRAAQFQYLFAIFISRELPIIEDVKLAIAAAVIDTII